jgi:hypothetical protein
LVEVDNHREEVQDDTRLDTLDMGSNVYTIEQLVEKLKDGEESNQFRIRLLPHQGDDD